MNTFPIPSPLLQRVVELAGGPTAIALCPDFELGKWRDKALINHLWDWLPEVALQPAERQALLYEPHKQLTRAAQRMFKNADPSKRGEVGEILLHAVCRQEFSTLPILARLFFKMRSNDQITGVDVVHLTYDKRLDRLDLWLGEAKLYEDVKEAKYKAYSSIQGLWNAEFLEEMKCLVGPKIERSAPYAERLAWLFEEETSLDQIIDNLVIPICICADFEATANTNKRTTSYLEQVEAELSTIRRYFQARVPVNVRFVCIFVPLDSKKKLERRMKAKVASLQ